MDLLKRNCCADGLYSNRQKWRTESKCAYSNVSHQQLTIPKRNVGSGVYSQRLRIFIRSQNLWDFALDKKGKTKPKDLASRRGASGIAFPLPHYA